MLPRMRAREYSCACLKYIEVSMTVATSGVNIDITILVELKRFIEGQCMLGCALLRGEIHTSIFIPWSREMFMVFQS